MRDLLKATKLVWSINRFTLLVILVIYLIIGCLPALGLLITKNLVNSVASFLSGHGNDFLEVFKWIVLQLTIQFIPLILNNINQYFSLKIEYKLNYVAEKNIMEKLSKLKYEMLEFPEFYNHVTRVIGGGNIATQLMLPIQRAMSASSGFISLVSVLLVLFYIHWSLTIISLLSFFPFLYFSKKFGVQNFDLLIYQTPDKRKIDYYRTLLFDKSSVKEIKIYDLHKYFINKWNRLYKKNMNEAINLLTRQEMIRGLLETIKLILYGGSAIILLFLLKNKRAQVGEFVSTLQAINEVQSQTASIASDIADGYTSLYYIKDYFALIDLLQDSLFERNNSTDKYIKHKISDIKEIEFRNASFSYPKSEKDALTNINLKIKTGETVAIVGENGSGKTTLINCLLGLYVLREGQILVNGINIKNIDPISLRKHFTVIFQDFMKYSFSIYENIVLGDVTKKEKKDSVIEAAQKSGVSYFSNSLREGLNTQLGRVFENGVDLSGGQWQKIAIARSIFRTSDVTILDEPTASLDPKSEVEIYQQFKQLALDKITIFISHRLGHTKDVDKIIVLKHGRIVEQGSHLELLNKKKLYYEMYKTQENVYKKDNLIIKS